jgi:hypothetical protein
LKKFSSLLPGLAALATLCLAHAAIAAPVGSLSCTGANGNDTSFNVSYFNFGVSNSGAGSQGSGAGAGKITYQPLEVHASLGTFEKLIAAAEGLSHFEDCKLTTTQPDGNTVGYEFRAVIVKSLTAVGERTSTTETPAQYTDVQLEYGDIRVLISGGTDDGGTTPASTTNHITIVGNGTN